MIRLLDRDTINQIAAGEVVERPSSVVKELVENSIDAGSTAITVEIKEGGLSFIRITDNGAGIEKNEVRTAFLRHATSKLETAEDLNRLSFLGFRGEALASIAAVSETSLLTKTKDSILGTRYEIHGGEEVAFEEIGCPGGTTIIVRNLFYNTPARKKFMKTPMTEGGYIEELVRRLAMSNPNIAFQFILNGQNRLSTSGNGRLKEVIYQIYGRDITRNLIEIEGIGEHIKMTGYIGKPFINRGNRSYENYFVNGRYMKNQTITKAIEEAFRTFVMIHKFPFTVIDFELEPTMLDVNVHPQKLEMRYSDNENLYKVIYKTIQNALYDDELMPETTAGTIREEKKEIAEGRKQADSERVRVEPFETARFASVKAEETKKFEEFEKKAPPIDKVVLNTVDKPVVKAEVSDIFKGMASYEAPKKEEIPVVHEDVSIGYSEESKDSFSNEEKNEPKVSITLEKKANEDIVIEKAEQLRFISEDARPEHIIIGQLFKTYWLMEYGNEFFIMDQHAAHEKVMYERFMKKLKNSEIYSQSINPPMVVTLSPTEAAALNKHKTLFESCGFQVESFGGDEYMLRAVPEDIFGIAPKDVFMTLISSVTEDTGRIDDEIFVVKLSMMACKAAVKGNTSLSLKEANDLIDELLTLDNPYNCPHGRPTIIRMTKAEIEKKFHRIQD